MPNTMNKQDLIEAVADALDIEHSDIKIVRTNIDGAVLDISGIEFDDEDEDEDLDGEDDE